MISADFFLGLQQAREGRTILMEEALQKAPPAWNGSISPPIYSGKSFTPSLRAKRNRFGRPGRSFSSTHLIHPWERIKSEFYLQEPESRSIRSWLKKICGFCFSWKKKGSPPSKSARTKCTGEDSRRFPPTTPRSKVGQGLSFFLPNLLLSS